MNLVRCPRCKTEHRLAPEAQAYTCAGCRTDWLFVQCAQCHSRFHSAVGIESWTCKRCGHTNSVPLDAIAAARRGSRLPRRSRLAVVAVPIVIAAAAAGILVAGSGGNGPTGPSKLTAARQSYC